MVTTNNIGCGYPGDPKTKAWLRSHLDANCGLPEIVRFSWKTTTNLMKEINCAVEFKSMMRNMTVHEYELIGFSKNYLNHSDYIKGKNLNAEKKETKVKVNSLREYKTVSKSLRMNYQNIEF